MIPQMWVLRVLPAALHAQVAAPAPADAVREAAHERGDKTISMQRQSTFISADRQRQHRRASETALGPPWRCSPTCSAATRERAW
jgi:hypothetical protein